MKPYSRVSVYRRGRRPSGFTLIELLVVIAIITILAGLIFPVFGRARGSARQKACVSNLRQCSMALRLYRDDYDEEFPPQNLSALSGLSDPSPRQVTGPEKAIWIGQLYAYSRSTGIMRCKDADPTKVDKLNGTPYGLGINGQLTTVTSSG